jgi:hypothetical protein
MAIAWHLLLERTRYTGKNFKTSIKMAFAAIEDKCNSDSAEHARVRKDVSTIRKEFDL